MKKPAKNEEDDKIETLETTEVPKEEPKPIPPKPPISRSGPVFTNVKGFR